VRAVKVKAGMTKLFWYEVETNKLIAAGYSKDEAHKIIMDRFLPNIEWKDELDEYDT
jgi:hypothetical protein